MPQITAAEDDPKMPLPAGVAADTPPPPVVARTRAATRRGKLGRLVATAVILILAFVAAAFVWQFYVAAPWTRDGRVRVQVANIAPQVSGQIVNVRVVDNQNVRRGDVLYEIEPVDFEVAIASAEADIKNREADFQVKSAQAARRDALTTISTSVEEKQTYAGTAKMAAAALDSAQVHLRQAKINLERTKVLSTVNGRVTNLLMRVGDYASAGSANISLVDTESFWVDGYFEETKMANVKVGDTAEIALMGYSRHLFGIVESITLGISNANAAPSTQGLPSVDPVYTWVRLAQRVPVRIRLRDIPPEIPLVAGMTATVVIAGGHTPAPDWFRGAFQRTPADTSQPFSEPGGIRH